MLQSVMEQAGLDLPFEKGVYEYAQKDSKKRVRLECAGFLACASVFTSAEAKKLQVATCRLTYDENTMSIHSTRP